MSPRNISAIFGLHLRGLLRTRTCAALLCLVIVSGLILPHAVRGDGTLEGRIHVLLQYALGLTAALLGLSTMWLGCAAIPGEITSRRIHLLASKPVTRAEIWLGCWLSLAATHVALLALAAGCVAWQARGMLRDGGHEARMMRYADRIVPPSIDISDTDVERRLEVYRSAGSIPEGLPPALLRARVRRLILREQLTVPRNQSLLLRFPLRDSVAGSRGTHLRFRLASTLPGEVPSFGRWEVRTAEGAWRTIENVALTYAGGIVDLPADARWGDVLAVRYTNTMPGEEVGTVIFQTEDGIQLRVATTSLLNNLVRYVLILSCQLTFFAAFGVMAGSLFSQSVAAFSSVMLWIVTWLARYIHFSVDTEGARIIYEGDLSVGWLRSLIEHIFRAVDGVTAPLFRFDVLSRLSNGVAIDAALVFEALGLLVVVYGGACALLGVVALQRRELGMPLE